MKQVVLHIGAHKCATTSVRQSLRNAVANDPSCEAILRKDTNRELKSVISLAKGKGLNVANVTERIRKYVDRSDSKRIIFSNENMLGVMPGLSWSMYPNAGFIRQIAEKLSDDYDVTVVLQSRDTASFIRSCYRYRAARGFTYTYEEFVNRLDIFSFSWMRIGNILFHEANFNYFIMPIQNMSDRYKVRLLAKNIYPEWDLQKYPIDKKNSSYTDVTICALQVLSSEGIRVPHDKIWLVDRGIRRAGSIRSKRDVRENIAPVLENYSGADVKALAPKIWKAAKMSNISLRNAKIDKSLAPMFAMDCARFEDQYIQKACGG